MTIEGALPQTIQDLPTTQTPSSSTSTTSSGFSSCPLPYPMICDVCCTPFTVEGGLKGQRCPQCGAFCLRADAPRLSPETEMTVRCCNGACNALFLSRTEGQCFLRCPGCNTLNTQPVNGHHGHAKECLNCHRFFHENTHFPFVECHHCKRSVFSGFSIKSFWGWIIGGVLLGALGVAMVLVGILATDFEVIMYSLLAFALSIFFIGASLISCMCLPRTREINLNQLEENIPFRDIQTDLVLINESVNSKTYV